MKTKNTIQIVETPIIDSYDFHENNGVINPAFLGTTDGDTTHHTHSLNHQSRPPVPPHQGYYFRPNQPRLTQDDDYRANYYPSHSLHRNGNGSIASSWVYEFNNYSPSTDTTRTTSTPETISMSGPGQGSTLPLPSIHRSGSYGRYEPHLSYDMDLTRDHKQNGGAVGADPHSGQCCKTMLRLFVWALILVSLLGIAVSVAFIIYIEKFAHQSCCANPTNTSTGSIISSGSTSSGSVSDSKVKNFTEYSVFSTTIAPPKGMTNNTIINPKINLSTVITHRMTTTTRAPVVKELTSDTSNTSTTSVSPFEPRYANISETLQTLFNTTDPGEVWDTMHNVTTPFPPGAKNVSTTTAAPVVQTEPTWVNMSTAVEMIFNTTGIRADWINTTTPLPPGAHKVPTTTVAPVVTTEPTWVNMSTIMEMILNATDRQRLDDLLNTTTPVAPVPQRTPITTTAPAGQAEPRFEINKAINVTTTTTPADDTTVIADNEDSDDSQTTTKSRVIPTTTRTTRVPVTTGPKTGAKPVVKTTHATTTITTNTTTPNPTTGAVEYSEYEDTTTTTTKPTTNGTDTTTEYNYANDNAPHQDSYVNLWG
ncbi:unnamed protein product [Oppiella nova]|uniref:Uncharacterized protein n=1 Tax=Oppiella nova TaxID=334625 RepID=A0A7R9MAU8_9ACAR|nr:unnamed protein product [Oppiella nova]CAG2172707.1 unnamed protein product [Oppiella nova]